MVHFARSWRPYSFDGVVGQELAVRILKNSLYRDQLFPVYLFMGQRGCGKTTLARIFACAINCRALEAFRAAPHGVVVPCGVCDSCGAFRQGSHPDFHEIDAASHPGVDNVRQVIETTLLAPQLGRMRMYLIDEAHMLSKAACNALLKTLEEPSSSVIFMLATTEPHKILDTVRSRCFSICVNPLAEDVLGNLIVQVCDKEQVPYEQEGVRLLVSHAERSARDALTLLERMILAFREVSAEGVRELLGVPADEVVRRLVRSLAQGDREETLRILEDEGWQRTPLLLVKEIYTRGAQLLWRSSLSKAAGAHEPGDTESLTSQERVRLVAAMERLFVHEPLVGRSVHGGVLLQLLLGESYGVVSPEPVQQAVRAVQGKGAVQGSEENSASRNPVPGSSVSGSSEGKGLADIMRGRVGVDALFVQVIEQATCRAEKGVVVVQFPERVRLFSDVIEQHIPILSEVITAREGAPVRVEIQFIPESGGSAPRAARVAPKPKREVQSMERQQETGVRTGRTDLRTGGSTSAGRSLTERELAVDELDEVTAAILQVFPGKVIKGE